VHETKKKKKLKYDSLRDTIIGLFITQCTVKYIIVITYYTDGGTIIQ